MTRNTLAAIATSAVVLLGASACSGSTGGSTSSATGSGSVASTGASAPAGGGSTQDISALPAATQAQLDKALLATGELGKLEGVVKDDPSSAFIANNTLDTATPASCDIFNLVGEAGGDKYQPAAVADAHIMEADASAPNTRHFVHLSGYTGKQAQAFMAAIKTALPGCASFKETGNGEHYQETLSPVSLTAGDEALAWRAEMTMGGKSFTIVESVVRVGSTVATFAEFAPKSPSLPITKQSIIDKQVSKMQAISKA
ncbi:hypothetical protein DN069_35990 [Streptacidiphilus pinicola]|uniref:Sensor domain-containing protein n=1 Tax=Streptacidiphilus pinicola TaxID=2219663 RepID=A0A2X0I796_9ACTN|nr:hypothetical protein [Streptacidiphilus pinicola]RAG80834.1 hypothetical protein DN069_35990 [Streptacidiphilus pinicola]